MPEKQQVRGGSDLLFLLLPRRRGSTSWIILSAPTR